MQALLFPISSEKKISIQAPTLLPKKYLNSSPKNPLMAIFYLLYMIQPNNPLIYIMDSYTSPHHPEEYQEHATNI